MTKSIKQITVTFDYDPDEDQISNLTTFVNGIEKKKTTPKAAPKKASTSSAKDKDEDAKVYLEDNKLVINSKASEILEVGYGDRIIIEYIKEGSNSIPIIGSDISWDKEGKGNKVTKTSTVSYRGNANKILSDFGSSFDLVTYKSGLYKLVDKSTPIKIIDKSSIEDIIQEAEKTEIDLLVETTDDSEIDEMSFTL